MMHRLLLSALFSAVFVVGYGCGDEVGGADTSVGDTGPGDSAVDSDTGVAGDAGAGYEPDWGCLGSVTIPPPTSTTAALTGTVRDYMANIGGEAGVTLSFCLWDDPDCAAPSTVVTTDDMGLFTATLPTDPDPYWGFAVATEDGFPRHEFLRSTPIFEDVGGIFRLLSTGALSGIAIAVGEPQDLMSNGAIGVYAIDCVGEVSRGVRFELASGSGTTFYGEGTTGISTTRTETHLSGIWGVLNAVPGDFTVAAFLAADHTPIGTVEFAVRAGSVSQVFMLPTPGGAVYSP